MGARRSSEHATDRLRLTENQAPPHALAALQSGRRDELSRLEQG